MKAVGIIQARMGSSRVPGKMLLPLDGRHVLEHIIHRVERAGELDDLIVATSEKPPDDLIEFVARETNTSVFRGSETDVLSRMHGAAVRSDADIVVRICGDEPLLSPRIIDTLVRTVRQQGIDYASNGIEQTFPRGLGAEAFTRSSFDEVEEEASKPDERESVTLYYKRNADRFSLENVPVEAVFQEDRLHDRTGLRLLLDYPIDYIILSEVYRNVPYDDTLDVIDAVEYIDTHDIVTMAADESG